MILPSKSPSKVVAVTTPVTFIVSDLIFAVEIPVKPEASPEMVPVTFKLPETVV